MELFEFEGLFQTYYSGVYRWLYYLLGERTAAEDLAQEVFLKLYCQPPGDKSNLRGWLRRVAANLAYNYLRSEERRRRREEGEVFKEARGVIALEEALLREEEARRVRNCLAQLSPRERLCLLLRQEGYSYAEIASIIQVDKNSVGTILARARRHFVTLYNRNEGREGHVSR
ncbi:MAG: sigma-70 family RNA polymerase sigma factor [Thermoanaerobacteraceae bacterium]|nr:sigma-70 family RNA polymerase sigma factor [Thermoanaerobacteraceae bacterium]